MQNILCARWVRFVCVCTVCVDIYTYFISPAARFAIYSVGRLGYWLVCWLVCNFFFFPSFFDIMNFRFFPLALFARIKVMAMDGLESILFIICAWNGGQRISSKPINKMKKMKIERFYLLESSFIGILSGNSRFHKYKYINKINESEIEVDTDRNVQIICLASSMDWRSVFVLNRHWQQQFLLKLLWFSSIAREKQIWTDKWNEVRPHP